jgi:hypothetical protein
MLASSRLLSLEAFSHFGNTTGDVDLIAGNVHLESDADVTVAFQNILV